MVVGVPREVKPGERRVGLTPAGVHMLTEAGHVVILERGAGAESGFDDVAYMAAGAEAADTANEVWARSDLIVKVKEPAPSEYQHLRDAHTVFAYFHFAASESLTRAVIQSGCVAIAYETIQEQDGQLPLLTPMSEVAGRLAAHEAAKYLQAPFGGRGVLMGGVAGVEPATVVVAGGGVVGSNAARIAAGLGARVLVLDLSLQRLRYLADVMPANVTLLHADKEAILETLHQADVFIGAVLLPGARAPRLLTRRDLSDMRQGAVVVDVAVDQGGCVETVHATTHDDPVYVLDGIVHYGVANMPAAVPHTSTRALTAATTPYVRALADAGWQHACRDDPGLRHGLNIVSGRVVCPGVAEAFDLEPVSVAGALNAVPVAAGTR